MSHARRLRELLAGDELIVAPGIFDGISAALVGKLAFPAAYMTGAGVSASGWGLPDIGLLTLTEMVERARVLAGLLDVPLIADADTGYGSPINVVRTVREYEAAGVAAIQLEDQTFPKRCGHLTGKDVVDADRFAVALEAALDARRDPDTVVVARTDALAPHGIDEAIARAQRYVRLGADVIFVEAPTSVEQIERIGAEVEAPLLLNIVPGGRTPEIAPDRLRELGFRVAIHPGAVLGPVANAAIEALSALARTAPISATSDPAGFFDLFGLNDWNELGERYRAYEGGPR
ncbi:MAG: 2,3-dimethylmalate lyase [Solirubrobacterales bacterium]|jgi:2-methylisocitrate lyase-like PEP mutase family enzyme|nr:2,3-dimethylmalate lyase [Solirubrobacterales bacterium]